MESSLIVDIVLLAILVVVGLIQAKVGFFQQLGSITGHALGFFLALLTSKHLIGFAEGRLTVFVNPVIVSLLAFEGLYIVYFFIIKWVGYKCSDGISGTKAEVVDKILGFLVGLILCFCILTLVAWLVDRQDYFNVAHYYKDSMIYKHLLRPAISIVNRLPSAIRSTVSP